MDYLKKEFRNLKTMFFLPERLATGFSQYWISENVETRICLQLISRKCLKKTLNVKSSSNVRMKTKHFCHTQQQLSPATNSKKYLEFLLQIYRFFHIIKKTFEMTQQSYSFTEVYFWKKYWLSLITSCKNVEFANFVSRMELNWSI